MFLYIFKYHIASCSCCLLCSLIATLCIAFTSMICHDTILCNIESAPRGLTNPSPNLHSQKEKPVVEQVIISVLCNYSLEEVNL